MPSLSERDLGRVEKLLNIIRSLLECGKCHDDHERSATTMAAASRASDLATTVTSSTVHWERQYEPLASTRISERRLWTEFAFLMSRVVAVQKLSLISYITSDPGVMVTELARMLLTFLQESCGAVAGGMKGDRIRHVALLAQDRLLFLLRIFCSLKNCTAMLSETSGCDNASAAWEVFNAICVHVISGQHLSWMSQIYVWFCDEAARLARSEDAMPSAYVYATHDVLCCILGFCSDHEECAKTFLHSEPVACVTYMFYGLKLRISAGDPLRPYEDEHPVKESGKGTVGDAAGEETGAMIPDNDEHSSGTPLQSTTSDATRAGPIPRRPPGARCLKTLYFATLIASSTQQQPQTPKESASAFANSATPASLVRCNSSYATGSSRSTSWAFNQPQLSRSQLRALLLAGRENAFDSLLFVALDIVIEAMRSTREYGHWMVLSTVSNVLLLSKKSIEVGDAAASSASGPILTSTSAVSPPLSQVVAMYENIVVLFRFLVSLMGGIGMEQPARSLYGSPVSAPGPLGFIGIEKGAKKGDERRMPPPQGSSSPIGGLSPPAQCRAEVSYNTATCETNQLLAAKTVDRSAKVAAMNTAQLREYLSQQIVHMVLQADVHAVLLATTRILECDQTLFSVLHSFCALEAQLGKPVKPAKRRRGHSTGSAVVSGHRKRTASPPKVNDTTSLNRSISVGAKGYAPHSPLGSRAGAAAAGAGASEDFSGILPKLDATSRLLFTATFGDLRCIANDAGCSEGLDGGTGENAGSRNTSCIGVGTGSSRGSGLVDSGTIALFGTTSMHSSVSPSRLEPGQGLLHPQQQHCHRHGDDGGRTKKRKGSAGDGFGGDSFAKSIFRSFFGNLSSGVGAVTVTRSTGNMGSDADAERDSWGGSSASASWCFASSEDGSSGSIHSGASNDDDLPSGVMGPLDGSGTGSLLSPQSFGTNGSGCRRALTTGTHRRHKSRVKAACSGRRDVPSYTALARELVRILNLVLADATLSVDVRLGAGLLLPSTVLRDSQVFRLYEGRLLIRNYLNLFLQELQYSIKLQGMSTSATVDREDKSHASLGSAQEHQQSTLNSASESLMAPPPPPQLTRTIAGSSSSSSSVVNGRAHLTQRELITFAAKVIETLEQSFKVLGVIPLTSDVVWLTELPLYFFCTDGVAALGDALESFFTRVVALWLIGLVGAQCNDDIDRRAMEVLMHLMSRAVVRGSLPKDSSAALMVTPSGATTVGQSGTIIGFAMPGGATAVITTPLSTPMTTDTFSSMIATETKPEVTTLAARSLSRADPQPPSSCIGLDATESDAETGLYPSRLTHSIHCTSEVSGVQTAPEVDAGAVECANVVEALSAVFRVLLSRLQDPLSPAALTTILSLFTSRNSNLSRLGRECMTRSLETPSVYPFYSDVIRDSNTFLLTEMLALLSAYLTSAALTPATRQVRRVWMQRFGCVDAVIRVLVRVLDSPQSTPNFMKVIPQLFQFLSTFESGDCKPPQLWSTNFIASVTERLAKLEGVEYFIVVTQAVLDASMGTHGNPDGSRTNAGDPRAHYSEVQVIGSFCVALYNCAAEKPIFLELLPSLLTFAKGHNDQLYANLVEALFRVLECTSIVRSERLADFALAHGLSQMLPYLEIPGHFIEERLPFTGTASGLHGFWQPILLRAPRRSRIRFTSHGGVQISVGLWPNTGFSISAWLQFDRLYLAIPLFEFHGVLSDGDSAAAVLRSSIMTASLIVFGGDSVQLTINNGPRVTINESEALQNFDSQKWVHVCAVLHATHILDVYVGGFKVGTTAFPYFAAGAEVRVNVGFTEAVLPSAASRTADASPLFSMGDIELWGQPLSRSQIATEFASGGDTRVTAPFGGHRGVFPGKIQEEGAPQELTLFRRMGVASGRPVPGFLGSTPYLSVGGLGALMNMRSQSASPSGAAGLSCTTAYDGLVGSGGDLKDSRGLRSGGAWWTSATRMARFVPLENDDDMLQNVLAYPTGIPVIAKLVGRYVTPPKVWVDYPLLWASRGGLGRMLDWMHLVTSSAQLEDLLMLISECFQRTTLAVTLDPRTYVLFAYMLTNHVARYMTNTACDQLLEIASSQIGIFVEHRVISNQLAFEHVLGDVALYAAMPLDTALYLLQRVRCLFQTSQCRYAKHNARFVSPYRFVDRLLHSLIGAAARTPLRLHRAVVKVAQQVVAACDMEDGLVQIFTSLVALLTPEERVMRSRRDMQVMVVLPVMRSVVRDTSMPLRTANHLTRLMLSSLIECASQSSCMSALSRTVDLPWYAVCLSRFADPAAVVYATCIFFQATQHNPVLHEEVAQHQSAVVEVLAEHAVHEDLILLLLALTMGATRHIDVLSREHSLRQQLDSLLNTLSPEPNALLAPIFVQLFVAHLDRIVRLPCQRLVRTEAMPHEEQRLSYRVRRYLSLARICSRLMIVIMVRRYRAFWKRRQLCEAAACFIRTPPLRHDHHPRVRGSSVECNSSQNVSFARSSGAGVIAGTVTPKLINATVASGARLRCAQPGLSSNNPLGDDSTTDARSSEGNAVVTGVEYSSPHLQSLRDASEIGRSNRSDGGDGGSRDEHDLPLRRTSSDGIVRLQYPMTLPAPVVNIGDDDHDHDSSGGGGEVQQWKPLVLLPDMRVRLPPSIPATAAPHELTAAASSSTSTDGVCDADDSPTMTLKASATNVVSQASSCSVQHRFHPVARGTDDSGGGNSAAAHVTAAANTIDGRSKERSDFYVRSSKHRRAFGVLRVTVLLWLSLLARRCQWVLKPRGQLHEEDLNWRRPGTLLCIRMLHQFASMSNYFYLFVNSPIQAAALSSLVSCISRDGLLEQLDTWDQLICSIVVAPEREPALVTATNADAAATRTPASEKPQQQQEDMRVSRTASRQDGGIEVSEGREGSGKKPGALPGMQGNIGPLGATHCMSSPVPVTVTAAQPTALHSSCSNSSWDTSSVSRDSAHEEEERTAGLPLPALPAKAPQRPDLLSSMTFRTAESSSTQLDQMKVLKSSLPSEASHRAELEDTDEASATWAQRRCGVVEDEDASSVTSDCLDVSVLFSAKSARVPAQRLGALQVPLPSPERCVTTLPQHVYTEAQNDELINGTSTRNAGVTTAKTATPAPTAADITARPGDANSASATKSYARDNDLNDGGTPSVSLAEVPVSRDSHTVSSCVTASSTLPMVPSAPAAAEEVSTLNVSFSNQPAKPPTLRTHDPSEVCAMEITRDIESAGEVVRRGAVSVLSALIRSSLDTLPLPNWIGGPTYGSCGGLLFQLLFIVSAKATADDSTTTLVRYFLLCVGNAVKEQRDRDLMRAPHHETALPVLKGSVRAASPLSFGRETSIFSDTLVSAAATGAGTSTSSNAGGLRTNVPLESAATLTTGVLLSMASVPTIASGDGDGGIARLSAQSMTPGDSGDEFYSQRNGAPPSPRAPASPARHYVPLLQGFRGVAAAGVGHTQQHSSSSGSNTTTGAHSDVFLFNVSHFTNLIVDMLAINVLELPMATHFFLTLLFLCQGWPNRYVDQLSSQVMRACIAVLNRPSTHDASVDLIESVYTLSTLVLRRGWKQKGVLESFLRVLLRLFVSLPPAWMPDADARHRKRLITLILRHLVQTYAGTKELEKALTMRTLTQRLSLYDDFVMVFSLPNVDECCATFGQYSVDEFSSLDMLMSGRLKAKADLAFKASIKTRGEYIKRIKAFNSQYKQVMEVPERYHRAALCVAYTSRFSSFVATTPRVESSQLHWLLSATCALRESQTTSCTPPWHMTIGGSGAGIGEQGQQVNARNGVERVLYHFMDPQMNYGQLKGVLWGEESASRMPIAESTTSVTTASGAPGQSSGSGAGDNDMAKDMTECTINADSASTQTNTTDKVAASASSAPTVTDENPPRNDLVHAAQCEELAQHIAVLLPPLSTRCRPHIGDDVFPTALKDLSISLTPSAITLLHYLVAPHETVRFLSNGFRINGIHATPCLILLTNVTLKVIGFSRLTEAGDIILCEHTADDDDGHSCSAASEPNIRVDNDGDFSRHHNAMSFFDDGKGPVIKSTRKNPFSMASMTRQLQKLFHDNPTKSRQQQDGTRVAQAMRQASTYNYQSIYWTYLVSSICAVRSLYYMHLDTAVQLQLYYDNGPMLSVVDAKQSMNPSARKKLIKVLRDVIGTQQCTFIDESQRAASMRTHLVRWATGSLSNYEYLRFLNEVAGRTNRDLNQYPVFPWVLADYTSTTLDLEVAATFRDFAYPMGAQTETRRAVVAQLFEDTHEARDVDTGKSYPFHHGTHYSTSGGVLYFLLRAQPFTTYARLFQGGDFDLAMRLFDAVAASFTSCVTGPADCKELIPEFYVNGEFLANADHLKLGNKSDGEAVDDVRLPPWAQNSRQVFTAVMRYALECPYVVEHLHQWIDLIFGVRRRGPLALERYNMFQRMTYGEEVVQALKNAETPHDCDVIIAEVDNFGQTPPQLFQERHPSHRELAPVVKASPPDGGAMGGGGMAWSNSHGNGGGGPAATSPAVDGVRAVTLSSLCTSSTAAASSAGAGSQLGVSLSNPVSSGAFASGQTYTQAFLREAPKVMRMLMHAMDEAQAWFVLRDPPSNALQHPPPPALADAFCFNSQAVLHFSVLRAPKKLACAYAQLVPVADTNCYLCWHKREAQIMRYTTGQGAFHSVIAFNPRDESGALISAVAVGPRESVLLVATSSGTVSCLFPDDTGDGALYVRATLCYHRSPVTKIVLESTRHRAVTITRSAGEDDPILWRVQRSGCCFICRLRVGQLLPAPAHTSISRASETAAEAAEPHSVVNVAIDTVSGNVALVTARSLLLFDNNGEPFGAGTLPSPTSLFPAGTATLEDDNGDVGVLVSRPVICVADITAVTFYQTSEWASGMGVILTGHSDGSLSVWRTTRLPPHTVAPGKIAMVEFHSRLLCGAAVPTAPATTSSLAVQHDTAALPVTTGGVGGNGSSSMVNAGSFASRGTSGGVTGAATGVAGTTAAIGTGAGVRGCPVTALHQENADVPTFFVGYANGTVRQLVFEDPMLTLLGGSGGGATGGGKDSGSGVNAGDEPNRRR